MSPLIYDGGLHLGEDSRFYLEIGFRMVGVDADRHTCEAAAARLQKFVDNGASRS